MFISPQKSLTGFCNLTNLQGISVNCCSKNICRRNFFNKSCWNKHQRIFVPTIIVETAVTTKQTKKRGRPLGSKNKPKQPGIENQKSKKPGPGQSRSFANILKTVHDFIESLDRSRSSINSEVPSRISRPVTCHFW